MCCGLQSVPEQGSSRSQLLVCHDLAGGYHQDAYVQVGAWSSLCLSDSISWQAK